MTSRTQIIAAAAVGVLVTALFFFLFLRPKLNDIAETRDQIESVEAQERQLLLELEQLREAREDRPTTVARLANANRLVPEEPDLPRFITQMQTTSENAGINLLSIAPGTPQDVEGTAGVQSIDVTLTIEGSFRRLEDFLIRLERLDRLVEVRSLTIAPGAESMGDQTILSTTISMQMYVASAEGPVGGGGAGATSTGTGS